MKITLPKSLLLMGAFLCFGYAQAQEVSGTVSDANGPLPGASVVEKGTTNGTQTDFDGNYTITVGENAILEITYIGYLGQEIAVNGQSTINVTLSEDAQALDEVVVVGYGSQQKKEITTAVVSIGEEDFNQGTISSPTQLLQGKVAGLSIYNKGGDPNATSTIRLRGISTIGGNTEPLIVIDGVLGSSLDNVDPSDIANITVLKDGSAAAIYGTRGSSGVILVTTKSGKPGQDLQITYNGQFANTTAVNSVPIMTGSEFLAAGGNDLGSTTDWVGEVTRNGSSQVHNVAAFGGTDKVNYRISTNFRDSEGILVGSGFNQFNARTKLTAKLLNDKLKVDFNSSLTQRDSDLGFYEALRYAVTYNPTAPVLGKNAAFPFASEQYGGYFETLGLFDSFNPVSIAKQSRNAQEANTLNYSMNFNYSFSDALSANVSYSEQNIKTTQNEYYPVTALWRGNAVSIVRRGRADFFTSESRFQLFEAFATYRNQLSDLISFTVTGGYSFHEQDYNDYFFSLGDFPIGVDIDFSNDIGASADLLTAGEIDASSSREDGIKTIAYFGRLNATFDDAIYLNASLRREGSGLFGSENQWGLFPAVAVGADLNKYLELDNVNLLKLRVGYGVTGSVPGGPGLYAVTFDVNNGGDGSSASSNPNRAENPDLKWEEKAELNFGLEYATDRLSATLDIYTRDVTDFIYLAQIDAALFDGIDQRFENAGALKTNGVELSVNYDIIKKENLSYNTGLVFSTYKTTLEKKSTPGDEVIANLGSPGQNDTDVILYKEGEEIGQIWGPVFSGEVDAAGTPILSDINGDGNLVTNQGSALDEDADFTVLGKGIPDFELGWSNQLAFGKWEVNAFFRAAFGHSMVNTFRAFYEPIIGSQSSYNFMNTKLARSDIKTAQFSSYYVEKADFVKLDNLSVAYNINVDNDYIKNIRLSLSGQNLFTITGYTGTDPTPSLQDGSNVLAPGIDRRNSYFASRTVTLGLNVNF